MPFQIKDFVSIVAAQINHARGTTKKITDFQPGSVARTLIEAPAVEIEQLYMQMLLGLRDAIPVATFRSFGFESLPSALARGWVNVRSATPAATTVIYPAGVQFTTEDGRTYTSTAPVTWPAGDSAARFPVAYGTVGLTGNAAAGAITASPTFGNGFTVNNGAITSGRDAETDADREARFADFIRSLSRGTVAACLYAAGSATVLDEDGNISEYVARTGIYEVAGYVEVYLYGSGGVASTALLTQAQRLLDGWRDEETGIATPGYRAAGVDIAALPMVERAVTLSLGVTMFPGYALNDDVRQRFFAIFTDALTSILPGETLYLGTLVELLLAVPGVRQIVPTTNENIACAANEALLAGVLHVAAL